MAGEDSKLWRGVENKLSKAGLSGDVRLFEFDPPHRREFLASLSVLAAPTPVPVAYGTYVIEASAAGIPVALPAIGSFPELLEATGGGVLYEPNDAGTLAGTLAALLDDEDRRLLLGRKGRESVVREFSLEAAAARMTEVYRAAVAQESRIAR
jgi:glycosyltransferase involved in cell wall biosynthesis